MTTIYLKHFELEHCLASISMVMQSQSNQDGANALTLHRLNKLMKDFQKEHEDYKELKANLLDKYVEGGSEDPKTEDNNFVFKSDKGKEKFLDAMESYTGVTLRTLLDERDLREFNCSPYAIQWISKLVRGEAPTERPAEMDKKASEESPEEQKMELVKEDAKSDKE